MVLNFFQKNEAGDWENSVFAEWLADLLAHCGASKTKLADTAGVGRNMIYRIQNGDHEPSISSLRALKDAADRLATEAPCEAEEAFELKVGQAVRLDALKRMKAPPMGVYVAHPEGVVAKVESFTVGTEGVKFNSFTLGVHSDHYVICRLLAKTEGGAEC